MNNFTSIGAFKEVRKSIMYGFNKYGLEQIPSVDYLGMVKLHGSNASVGYKNGELFCQSRKRVLSISNDHMGFAMFVEKRKDEFLEAFKSIGFDEAIVYGEWAGPGVQKGVGISQIDQKSFFAFSLKVKADSNTSEVDNIDGEEEGWYYLDVENPYLKEFSKIPNCYSLLDDFITFRMKIDFSQWEKEYQAIEELTEEIDKSCPVAAEFNIEGPGEGIVWRPIKDYVGTRYWFKSKGQSHKEVIDENKQINKANPNNEKLMQLFINYGTEARFKKGLDHLTEMGYDHSMPNFPHFIRWITSDIVKEAHDFIVENEIDVKNLMGIVGKNTVQWYKSQ